MEAYIYTYVNKETGKTYIGSRSAYVGSCYDDFNIKYFSSSKDKQFRQDMADGKLEGQIVLVMNDENANKKIVDVESQMITAYWEKYGKENSYNHHNNNGKFSVVGTKHTEEHNLKISESKKGKPRSEETKEKLRIKNSGSVPPNKGIPMSEDQKQKLSEARKGKHFPKLSEARKGHKVSDETKLKMKDAQTGDKNHFYGKKHSSSSIEKMRQPRTKYEYINNLGEIVLLSKQSATRWHPDYVLAIETKKEENKD